jgi:hypothetical protein
MQKIIAVAWLFKRLGTAHTRDLLHVLGEVMAAPVPGLNLAKTKILAKYNTVNQVDRRHGGTKPAHAVRE